MLNLLELEQLVAFADLGILSKAAQKLNISQPSITRTMQHIEDTFGVSLFVRSKNHIALNETGWKAVEYARQLLHNADQAIRSVRDFDRSQHTITVHSCAPAPLWYLLPALSEAFPGMAVTSSIMGSATVMENLEAEYCQLAITTERISTAEYNCIPFLQERLFACVSSGHELAGCQSLSFADLNGYNFLLLSKLGFWDDLCRAKMPASKFLVQPDKFELQELIRESSLPCFTTDLVTDTDAIPANRVKIPIVDTEASVTYFAAFFNKCEKTAKSFTRAIRSVTG